MLVKRWTTALHLTQQTLPSDGRQMTLCKGPTSWVLLAWVYSPILFAVCRPPYGACGGGEARVFFRDFSSLDAYSSPN